MQELIRADNLCKRYGSITALDGVSLAAHAGECVGIFGASGAGKSAAMRVLAGIEAADSGAVSSACRLAGISSQAPSFNGALTPAEALWLYAALYEIPRGKRHAAVRETLALVGLDSRRNRCIRSLPGSAHKLLDVARALLSPSDLLLLDEPMAGLDFGARARLWEHLLSIRTRGVKAVVLATSCAEDAELCDNVVLLHEGRVLASGTPAELRSMVGPEALVIKPVRAKGAGLPKAGWPGIVGREEDGSLVVEIGPESRPSELLGQISGSVAAVRLRRRGLDSVLEELAKHGVAE
ncbi:MAG TPA: ABC transporter ATP-binding protein [Armatimonadota bacterium]|nr:ABC transporter ATP-binding protein [Armatimonadota bacterium]